MFLETSTLNHGLRVLDQNECHQRAEEKTEELTYIF